MKIRNAILSGVAATFFAASASAAVINDRSTPVATDLQSIFDTKTGTTGTVGTDPVDATLQSGAAIWGQSDSLTSSSFAVTFLSGTGTLAIYSQGDGINASSINIFALTGSLIGGVDTFRIFNGTWAGTTYTDALVINGAVAMDNFGEKFGFAYGDYSGGTWGSNTVYTEDSMNGNAAKSVSYQLSGGTAVTGLPADTAGNDDWIIAFENNSTAGTEFTDGIFFIEDIAVSAPATLALMGLGLLGLAYSKRRKAA